jgi:hypothetical protein
MVLPAEVAGHAEAGVGGGFPAGSVPLWRRFRRLFPGRQGFRWLSRLRLSLASVPAGDVPAGDVPAGDVPAASRAASGGLRRPMQGFFRGGRSQWLPLGLIGVAGLRLVGV